MASIEDIKQYRALCDRLDTLRTHNGVRRSWEIDNLKTNRSSRYKEAKARYEQALEEIPKLQKAVDTFEPQCFWQGEKASFELRVDKESGKPILDITGWDTVWLYSEDIAVLKEVLKHIPNS